MGAFHATPPLPPPPPVEKRARLRVLIADDHVVILEALAALLTAHRFHVVGAAENGRRAVVLARKYRPDVVLLDVAMPVMGGLEAARHILRAAPDTMVLFLTGAAEDRVVLEGLRIGVRGFVVKAQGSADLFQAIRDVSRGAVSISACYSRGLMQAVARGEPAGPKALSDRELQMLRLIAEGTTAKQAASLMAISVRTAESHRARVMHKLGIHDTAGLVRYAIRQGVVRA